ncbi:hypothetical protein PO124_06710 [Bacillus licheniformis]|nr:hypothetical protein [Bacillus licheniformis]
MSSWASCKSSMERRMSRKLRNRGEIASYPAPRGKMYDRYGRVVVDNQSVPAITYTMMTSTKRRKNQHSQKLAELIDIDTSFLKERDLKDYWLARHPKKLLHF